jgi:hypothetical protein
MSYVHVLIAKDDRLYLLNVHYRTAMKLLEKGAEKVLPLLKHSFLDSGYLVVDLNRDLIVNGQTAFPLSKVLGKKKLCVIET